MGDSCADSPAAADVPFFHEVRGQLGDEAAGLHEDVAVAGLVVDHGVAGIELILGAGDGDVEEAALLLDAEVAFLHGAGMGEHAVGQPDGEDSVPFQDR